jgi:hypothetical protein
MTPQEFATKIRQKYPGSYDGVPDEDLAKRVIAKYPVYASQVKFPEAPKKSLGQRVLDAGTKVADFVGAEGISEQFGASMARVAVPEEQEANVDNPSLKKVIGSAVQTGANFIPGAGTGANLAGKVAIGAGIGYANDLGSKLQREDKTISESLKPGVATVVGGLLPVLGKITGLSDTGKFSKNYANKLEELNLRLTPTERQNLVKQGKQISSYLADKKIVGTPAQRYAKVEKLNDLMEEKVSKTIDTSGVKLSKKQVIDELKKIPEKYTDNLSEYDSVVSKVDRIVKTLTSNFPDAIEAKRLNLVKRNEWKNAFSKNNSDVVNEVSHEVGMVIKKLLDSNIKGLSPLNEEYGKLITARKALFKASTRSQVGLLGKTAGLVAGTSVGGALAGPGGAAVGAFVGPQVTNALGTPVRGGLGATLQRASETISKIPADKRGKILINRKALLNLITKMQEGR